MRNILPTNTNIAISDDEIATAVTKVMTDTSIMQPLVSEMSNYWSPAETNIPVFVRDRVMDIANKAYVRNASFQYGLCDFIHGIIALDQQQVAM